MTKTKNLDSIIQAGCVDFTRMADAKADEILTAIEEVKESALANDTEPVFNLNLTIKMKLAKREQENVLSWSVRTKCAHSLHMPDPSQIELPLN